MQIYFITSFFKGFHGGGTISLKLLAEHLEKKKHEVYILTTRKTVNSTPNIISLPYTERIPEKLIKLGNNSFDHLLAFTLKKILRNNYPDLLHVQDRFILPATTYVAKEFSIPIVATMRSNARLHPSLAEELPPGVSWLMRKRNRAIMEHYKKVDAIISVSDYIGRELAEAGVPRDKITTIYNLPPPWKPIEDSKTSGNIILLALGSICKYKGFEVLAKAVSLAVKKCGNIRVIIAGKGPYSSGLRSLVRRLNLTDYMKLVGVVSYENIRELYFSSDIVLLLSIHPEPFSRVLLEAMAAGKPVIATNTGGTPEGVKHGVNGLLVPPNDPEKTAESIIKLAGSEELRNCMGRAGRRILEEKFNPENLIGKTIKLYNKVIVQHGRDVIVK